MGKILDRILFNAAALFLTFAWSYYFTQKWLSAVVLSVLVWVLLRTAYAFFASRRKASAGISANEICVSFALMGMDKATKHLYETIPEDLRVRMEPQYILADLEGKRTLIFVNYKFANTVEDDIARVYRKAVQEEEEERVQEIIVLSRHADRRVMTFAASLGYRFSFPEKHAVKMRLAKQNALPLKMRNTEPQKRAPFPFKLLFAAAMDRRRIKYYFFTGIMLFLMSFLTPLKLYYLIMASVPFVLALVCAVYHMIEDRR